ncbi:MAG TPA: M60 family metallopeptidase [Candidatus Borkfalkia excrementigallinarum]|uniref:M60 family metallopeptidase n=1 Tax=Candidatus Borkfalkia excrementigallinarum TaxID=2838506 RepID=A0A9D2CS62_9FIRM|nr:M60 family metallopeptidase [Candidatus Borkfalkia excrementigallinarum]
MFQKRLLVILSAAFSICLAIGMIAMSFTYISAEAEKANCTHLSDNGLLSEGYLTAYRYGTKQSDSAYISSYTANGGNYGGAGGNTLEKAFDGNFSTFWETNRPNADNFINTFTVTFSKDAQIDRIIYATRQDAYAGRGYPSVLTVFISPEESGDEFEKICTISSSYGGNKVIFDLGDTYQCRRMRLEFTEISSSIQYASASELIFLKPEESSVQALRGAFADYTRLTFTDAFKQHAEQYISEAKKTAAYAYSEEVRLLADRAESVLNGEISFDPAFELSTASGAKNPIVRAGDTAGYARNTLKMVWMGTNRQVTGIGAKAGATLKVFVDCADGDPLPSLECTQFCGTWQGWRSGAIALSKGINFITVPNYYQSGWTNTVPGGPLYIVNPYTEAQQSDSVKVYIEGGYAFPVYREGTDEAEYRADLESYLEAMEQNPDLLPNMTEITNKNVILTVTATQARKQYIEGSHSPAQALKNWEDYLSALYDFCGVYNAEHADARAQYLNVNIRVMQPLAGAAAYAYGEHIGIYPNGDWEVTCLQAENFGWGVSHELGHMMEISERTWGEYTNNMWSQFNKCALAGEEARGNYANFLAATVQDGVPYEERDAYTDHTDAALSWWVIESRYPGFWGRFENNYRYADRAGITDKAELHVYFASLAAGTDLSYYFERIGFNWSGNDPFSGYETASDAFRSAIDAALTAGKIKNDPLKLWYLDAKAYNYTAQYGDELKLYRNSDTVRFMLRQTSQSATLLMNETKDFRHLGYEILRGNEADGFKVIGFTYGRIFTDPSPAEDGEYRVRAYDRALGSTALSSAENTAGAAARVNGQDYATLAEAVRAANSGDTVYILADAFAAGIAIDKNLTLAPLSSDVTVYLSSASAMFTVQKSVSLLLDGSAHTLTLDGLQTAKNEAMIVSDGTLAMRGKVVLQNSVNGSANGGALRVSSGALNIESGVIFRNNRSANGGAIVSQAGSNASFRISGAHFAGNTAGTNGGAIYANCVLDISDTVFEDNAAANGGAICINGGGILTLSDCTFENNAASAQGGALRLDGKTSFAGELSLFSGNTARQGGAIYVASENNARRAAVSAAEFMGNTAEQGGALYVAGFAALGAEGTSLTIAGAEQSGSTALFIAQSANLADIAGSLTLSGGVVLYAPLTFGEGFSTENSAVNALFALAGGEQTVIARFASAADAMQLRSFAAKDGAVYAAILESGETGQVLAVSSVNAYFVTVADGQESGSAYYISGETFVLPQAEPPQGYTFKGWLCDGKLYAAGEEITVASDMTFTAEYERIQTDNKPPEGTPDGSDDDTQGGENGGNGTRIWIYVAIGAGTVLAVGIIAAAAVHAKRKKG